MKIVLATYGSRGDVQPMLALSLALQSAGHRVLLAGPPEKASWAKQLGCPFHPLGSDCTAFIDGMKNAHSIGSAFQFVSYVRKEILTQFETLPAIVAGADLVIGASLVFALSSVAESMAVPYRYIAFTPQLLPSGHHPFPTFKHQWLPVWYNRMTWRMIRMFDRLNLTRVINKKRKGLGLKPIQDAWSKILGHNPIVATDREVAEIPSDVGASVFQSGYIHLVQPDKDLPELELFLKNGFSPVYAGFGSMPKQDQANIVSLVVEAARSIRQRVVIAKFWDEPSGPPPANDVFFIKRYPHLKLFPRMAAVIHHGGAGTTASSAISGVPQIIVPHILDQFYWGHRVHRCGLGPKPVWRSKLTSGRLAATIAETLSNDKIKEKAKVVSKRIKRQNGLEIAVREILNASSEERPYS